MALVRMTEKKLAANRANACLSKGPTTPAGKEKVSRNACKHHLFARKFVIHPEWDARIRAVVLPAAAAIENRTQRLLLTRYLYLAQWAEEVAAFDTRLLRQSIANHRGDIYRGAHAYVTTNPLFPALQRKLHKLNGQANRARIDWERSRRTPSIYRTLPHLLEFTPVAPPENTLAMAAGVGAWSSQPLRQSPIRPTVAISPITPRDTPQSPPHRHANLWYHRMRPSACQFFEQPPLRNRLRNQ